MQKSNHPSYKTNERGKEKEKVKESGKTVNESEKTIEYVFVLDGEKASLRMVVTGIQDNNYIEIVSGVKEGEEIIYGPYSAVSKMLKNAMPVKKVEKEELFENQEKKE